MSIWGADAVSLSLAACREDKDERLATERNGTTRHEAPTSSSLLPLSSLTESLPFSEGCGGSYHPLPRQCQRTTTPDDQARRVSATIRPALLWTVFIHSFFRESPPRATPPHSSPPRGTHACHTRPVHLSTDHHCSPQTGTSHKRNLRNSFLTSACCSTERFFLSPAPWGHIPTAPTALSCRVSALPATWSHYRSFRSLDAGTQVLS